jgi:transcriptional regulator NrdR family protein
MTCPYCKTGKVRVVFTRPTVRGRRRTYECKNKQCRKRFSTLEVPEHELSHSLATRLRYGTESPQHSKG